MEGVASRSDYLALLICSDRSQYLHAVLEDSKRLSHWCKVSRLNKRPFVWSCGCVVEVDPRVVCHRNFVSVRTLSPDAREHDDP